MIGKKMFLLSISNYCAFRTYAIPKNHKKTNKLIITYLPQKKLNSKSFHVQNNIPNTKQKQIFLFFKSQNHSGVFFNTLSDFFVYLRKENCQICYPGLKQKTQTQSGQQGSFFNEQIMAYKFSIQFLRELYNCQYGIAYKFYPKQVSKYKYRMQTFKSFFASQVASSETDAYENYRQMTFNSLMPASGNLSEKELESKAKEIFEWAKKNGALYYSFLAYPHTGGILEKQETFLDLQYYYDQTLMSDGKTSFSFQQLGKGEGDGSSFPSGGLRVTHQARAYTVWDTKSEVFIRKANKVLYIPSLLVTHQGKALDDKTLFRKSEKLLQKKTIQLLKKLNINSSAAVMALGLEQQFFVIPKSAADKRIDIKSTGRALIGKMPAKHQQFSDHYYGKLPAKVEQILREVEAQLLQIGVPCKTRHKQVAPCQFQFCPLFEEAGKSIDHNMILMEVMKEKFEQNELKVLFHQKPFANMNGSGKHCNWSLNYIDQLGRLKNLFATTKDEKQLKLFKLFVLIQLKALMKHSKLYLTAISCSGNELRLGGHEAPPRIISAFLGQTVSSILDDTQLQERKNLKQQVPNINFNLLQEDTDRNRTSPYAYTGNKFQFRAVGSSQNVSFPMAVIAATMAKEIDVVLSDIEKGTNFDEIITKLRDQTKPIRFEGNGYSKEWPIEAKKRGLYVNEKFYENIENFKQFGKVFVEIGACSEEEVTAKYQGLKQLYRNTVQAEANALASVLNSQVIPLGYEYLKMVEPESKSKIVNKRSEKFIKAFEDVLEAQEVIEGLEINDNMQEVSSARRKVNKICETVNKLLSILPKSEKWVEFEDFMHHY